MRPCPVAETVPMSTRTLLPTLAAGVALALGAPAAHAGTVLSTEASPTSVAAYGGTIMWSSLDPVTGNFKLMKSIGGAAPTEVDVPQHEAIPFDIDLGTNRAGSIYAVYTRAGDLYRLNPRTEVEQRLVELSDPKHVERDPSIQRGRIAFIRRGNGKDQIRIGETTSAGTPTKLVTQVRHVRSLELGISHLSYLTSPRAGSSSQDLHVRTLRTGLDRIVATARSGGASQAVLTRPAFTDDLRFFVWARTNLGSGTGNRIVRYSLRTRRLTYAQGTPRIATLAWAGNGLGAAVSTALDPGPGRAAGCEDGGMQYCQIKLTGALRFDLKP